ncbi:MAG: dockerin type I repeat-containing protein, partial [Planctomycetota bacterium]
ERSLEARVLVTPKCFCDMTDPCAGAFVFLDTPQTPPGAPSDLSDPGDDVQFRLAVEETITSPPGVIYHDLNAEVRVLDLCPDVADGPKYFMVTIDDLGSIPASPHLDDFVGRPVYLQGRTNCTRQIDGATTVCEPVPMADLDLWWNIGGPMTMLNYPSALDAAFWSGYFDEADQTYRFTIRGSQNTEESFVLEDTAPLDFGIVDAGIPSYAGNNVNAGFTSRIAWQGGNWFAEQGLGSSSGRLLENELTAAPQVVTASQFDPENPSFGAGGGIFPAYRWCQQTPIFSNQMSQELFRSIIYAGPIGPIPVNIWGSVGLGLAIAIDSYIEFRASPFVPMPSGNFVEMQYTLVSQIDISIPCQISCDILGGIASIGLGLRPDVAFDFAPYVIADLGGSSTFDVDYYLKATFALVMEATACVQTLLFGEQCLPVIEIPLIPETDILPQHGTDPTPAACGGSGVASSFPSSAGAIVINQYELASAPVSITSPDGQVVVDAWVSDEVSGKLLKVCVTEQGGISLTLGEAIPGFSWYLLDPDATFIDNDTAIFAATGPPAGFTPGVPPSDLADPDYFDIRNANMAHTEIQIAVLRRTGPLAWELTVDEPDQISDLVGTPTVDRRADGRAAIAADLPNGEALVSWVRYTGDYLIQDGFTDFYVADPSCTAPICLAVQQPNIRPQMEATSVVVRRVDDNGVIPGEEIVTISNSGINVQPSISMSPTGDVGYCAWVHDATNVDLLTNNQGRQIHYSIYDGTTDTWSPPIALLPFPDEYPGILEPYMVLKDDQSGILAFTALPAGAAPDDSGLGGGSRLLYACRLENGIFGPPVLLRGACQPRQYGWKQQIVFDLPTLVDEFTLLEMRQPDYVMAFQEFGVVGLPEGSGNVMLSVLPQGSDSWTPAQPMLPQGGVVTNVSATLFNGGLHSVYFDAGPSTPTSTFGPIVTGYKIEQTPLEPDASITRCSLRDPFAGPGVVVDGEVVVENLGFYSTPYNGTSLESATGLEVVLVENDGTETVVDAIPLPVLDPMESTTVPFAVEMPHDPVRLVVRIFPNPIDRDPSNDMRECFFGAPSPTNFACSPVENSFEDGSSVVGVRLTWENPALYEHIFLYRDGSMIHVLPGGCESFTDLNVDLGLHTYELRGRIAASKSVRVALECEVAPPPPPGPAFTRGDANGDMQINIADAVYSLEYLFIGGPVFPCFAAADTNFDGQVNVADVVYLLAYSFQGGSPPPVPFPDCAPSDEESDIELSCENEGC